MADRLILQAEVKDCTLSLRL